jgi:hypothetical protein
MNPGRPAVCDTEWALYIPARADSHRATPRFVPSLCHHNSTHRHRVSDRSESTQQNQRFGTIRSVTVYCESGSNPGGPTINSFVRTGHIGNTLFLRHR